MAAEIPESTMRVAPESRGKHAPPKEKCDRPVAVRHSLVRYSGGCLGLVDSSCTVRNGQAKYRATSRAQRVSRRSGNLLVDSGGGCGIDSTATRREGAPTCNSRCMKLCFPDKKYQRLSANRNSRWAHSRTTTDLLWQKLRARKAYAPADEEPQWGGCHKIVLRNEVPTQEKPKKVGKRIALSEYMRTAHQHATALPVPAAPQGIDPHCETDNRVIWNDQAHTQEEHEFVYEISWVPELGVWRRFLRAHHKT